MSGSIPSTRGGPRNQEPSDEELLVSLARGDQSGLSLLYDRFQGQMYGLAMRITGETSLAQDVVQDAFLGLWRNAGRYSSDRASARTWILSITHHRAIDAIRRRRATVELPEPPATPASVVIPDIWPEVAGRLDRDAVDRALATLSDVQREAISLAYFGGLTQHEIAERTETPLGTVKSRVRLGLLALRRALEPEFSESAGSVADQAVL
jgi:RNA polymerase sigma-70 factor, ECF subfamily